ncbi:MAG: HAD family hydrolase [Myxococcales bacterium]|nr:HAD family hydrolase [Myxococcales bacterium]
MLYLFDLDGTLMTSAGSGGRAFARACAQVLGIARALDGVVLHGNTDPLILEEVCQRALGRPPTADEATEVIDAYLGCLGEELARPRVVEVLPAVREVLATLATRGALCGLATGNVLGGARLKLEAAGLWEHFPFGGFGSDSAVRTELVQVAIARAERFAGRAIDRRQIRVIGDTPRDVAAARGAGVRAVAVATGIHDVATLRATGADEVHQTLATLLDPP